MKRTFTYVTLLFLIFINIALLFKYNKLKIAYNFTRNNESQLIYYKDKITTSIFHERMNANTRLRDGIVCGDVNGKFHKITDMFDSDPKIVIYHSETGCGACIENELNIIKKYSSLIGLDNIFIITNIQNIRKLRVFIKINDINLNIFYCSKLGLPFEKENDNPFVFVTDKTLIVKHFFVPNNELPELSENYYSSLHTRYFSNE